MPNSITLKDVNGNAIYPSIDASTLSGTIEYGETGFTKGGDVYDALETVSGDITALIPTNYYPNNNPSGFLTEHQDLSDYATKTYVNEEIGKVGHYHIASATVTNTGNNFTITLSSNNSYVALDSNDVSGNQSLTITIVPPPLEGNELLDCMVQFRPIGGQSTTGHNVNVNGLFQVGLRNSNIGGVNVNYIRNGELAQIRLLGNTYCLL